MARGRRHIRLLGDVARLAGWFAKAGRTSVSDGTGLIARFEAEFGRMTGSAYALAMNSGTAALHSAYFAVGVGPGTEVIVPSYTWHSSATPILQCGAVPVFCDVDPMTLTLDPDDVARRITARTRAICAVHTWGNPARMDYLTEIARERGIAVVEDCSHAHGATYRHRAVGSWGDIGCFSLHASKPVAAGEAGVVVTDNPQLHDAMLFLGHPGRLQRGQAAASFDVGEVNLGPKYRPHAFAIHLATSQLRRLSRLNARRARLWARIEAEIAGSKSLRPVAVHPGGVRGGFYRYVIRYTGADRDGPSIETVVRAARARGIPIGRDPYAAELLHRSPVFASLDRRALGGGCFDPTRPWEENVSSTRLPVSEALTEQVLAFDQLLPLASESFVSRVTRALVALADDMASRGR